SCCTAGQRRFRSRSAPTRPTARSTSCVSSCSFDETRWRVVTSTAAARDHIVDHAPVLLRVDALSKRYGEQHALADVSFDVRAIEILGLIGPNGAGKTTLLEAIAGLIPVDHGRVLWRGADLPIAGRRELMFFLPDGLRPWQEQYALRVIELFAAAYGRSD